MNHESIKPRFNGEFSKGLMAYIELYGWDSEEDKVRLREYLGNFDPDVPPKSAMEEFLYKHWNIANELADMGIGW